MPFLNLPPKKTTPQYIAAFHFPAILLPANANLLLTVSVLLTAILVLLSLVMVGILQPYSAWQAMRVHE